MPDSSLWERLKRARVAHVVVVYLGASWILLQIAELLVDALALPPWVMPVAVLLLLIGLLVIGATAWVQSLPATSAREAAGEVPRDWQIAPTDALASLRRGRLPHLTWGRSILGGVVVLVLLFGGAGVYVGVRGGGAGFGPAEAAASEAAAGIAVVPFTVRGEGLEIWREGMMDLLSNSLDGVGGFRTIDARTVMARWQQHVGDAPETDLATALRVAATTGALYALEGSVVGLGTDVRLAANVYSLDTERELAQATVQGPVDEVLRLVDELAVATMRDLIRAVGREGAGDLNAETLTTTSLPALRAFLEGESHYRRGRFAEAVQSYERAVAEDTTFAVALVRLAEGYGWLESTDSDRMQEYGERAERHVDRLSPRYRFIMEGWSALNRGSADGVESLKEAVQRYPDDPEAWFLLAETYLHVGGATYGTREDIRTALERAIALDPGFAPYRVHQAEHAVLAGDRLAAREAVDTYYELTGAREGLEAVELAIPLLLGDSAEAEAALVAARSATPLTLSRYFATFPLLHDRLGLESRLYSVYADAVGDDQTIVRASYAAMAGEIGRGHALVARAQPFEVARFWAYADYIWDLDPPGPGDPRRELTAASCEDPVPMIRCQLYLGLALDRWDRPAERDRIIGSLRAAADSLRPTDAVGAAERAAWADIMEGVIRVRSGDVRGGRALLVRHHRTFGLGPDIARLELGWIEVREGRLANAIAHFRSVLEGWNRPVALYGLATTHERLGEHAEARRAWERLAAITRTGDDLPRIREIRQRLAREGD